MSLHTIHNEPHQVYFCTITCYKWLPLFEKANAYSIVYTWFQHIGYDGCNVVGYVIMPNHFHVLLQLSHSGTSVNKLVAEGKRFMAYAIASGLKKNNETQLLQILQDGVSPKEKLKSKVHQVFKPSFDGRLCYSEEMIEQKLGYIHHNPVSGKWNLANDFASYEHSSAGFYELGSDNKYVTHYKDLKGE
jgi:REP element-mobilizing transposase RayT